jgi:hypothetical protein
VSISYFSNDIKDVLITAYLNQLGIGLGSDTMDMAPQPPPPTKRKNTAEDQSKKGKEETL